MIRLQIRSIHFNAGDHALLRPITNPSKTWITTPLTPTEKVNVDRGNVPHSSIIGLKPRSLIKLKNQSYIVTKPTTEEYITLGKRAAQPIYHHDANAIVNLADVHSNYPKITKDETTGEWNAKDSHKIKQYLEAGTGHASLCLSIAQRIHSANCFLEQFGIRGAVLHSVDNNPSHSKRGSSNLREFRNGIYKDDVEFYVAEDLSTWFGTEEAEHWKSLSNSSENEQEFLDAVFLDMPSIQTQLTTLTPHLKHDAPLITFVPSVTQIIDILHTIQDLNLPLIHIGTYQLGSGTNGGGLNEWDVKFTKVRKTGQQGVVCRPKVGVRVVGGGFVAVFRKLGNGMVKVEGEEDSTIQEESTKEEEMIQQV